VAVATQTNDDKCEVQQNAVLVEQAAAAKSLDAPRLNADKY
jgi:hypothetical protein